MYLIELEANPQQILKNFNYNKKDVARVSGGEMGGVTDVGYQYKVHAWLYRILGENHVPKTFRILFKNNKIKIIGYYNEELQPEVVDNSSILSYRALKVPEFIIGQKLQFNVLAIPTIRKKNKEMDTYLNAIKKTETTTRTAVYNDWLKEQLTRNDAINSIQSKIIKFKLTRQLRQGAKIGYCDFILPEIECCGEITVHNPSEFLKLIWSGIGRHKSFGYGALMLNAHVQQ